MSALRYLLMTCAATIYLSLPGAVAGSPVAAQWGIGESGSTAGAFGASTPARGQTFTPECGGRLETISLWVGRSAEHTGVLEVAVRLTDSGGLPTGDPLAQIDVEYPALGPVGNLSRLVAFDFSAAALLLESGTQYAVTLTPSEPDETNSLFITGGFGEAAGYEGGMAVRTSGETWFPSATIDWGFEVVVESETPVQVTSWGGLKADHR